MFNLPVEFFVFKNGVQLHQSPNKTFSPNLINQARFNDSSMMRSSYIYKLSYEKRCKKTTTKNQSI